MVKRAAIVGAGISSLAAAVALRQVGIGAEVFVPGPAIQGGGSGLCLWPNATRSLELLSVLPSLRKQAATIDRLVIRTPGGNALLNARTHLEPTPTLGVTHEALVGALLEQIPPEAIHLDQDLSGFTQDPNGIRLFFQSGAEVGADIVVGADGPFSNVRNILRGNRLPVAHGYEIFRGITHLPDFRAKGEMFESWGKASRFGLVQVGHDDTFSWYATLPARRFHPGVSRGVLQMFLGDAFAHWHDPIPEAIVNTDPATIARSVVSDRPPRSGWAQGRVVLLGEAAHPTTPDLGQGVAMGLEDALVLADCLRVYVSPDRAFARYEDARFTRTSKVVRQSRKVGAMADLNGTRSLARNFSMRVLPNAIYEQSLRGLFRS